MFYKSLWGVEQASSVLHKISDFWKQFVPNVVMAKPLTDLCFTWQQNTFKLVWADNLPEEEKSQCVQVRQPHLNSVQTERELYRKVCEKAKCSFEELEDQIDLEESHESCMLSTMRYIHPAIQCSPGLSSLKRCVNVLFLEWCAKAIPQQVNYLVDEASDVSKGANTTVSYVHHYFEHHALTETSAHLHADIYSGQNKNNYFMWYLAWRTILQLHHSIRYSFLIAGHTKFGPNSCFSIIKKSELYFFTRRICQYGGVVMLRD